MSKNKTLEQFVMSLLQTSTNFTHIVQTHALIIKTSLHTNTFIITKLIRQHFAHSSYTTACDWREHEREQGTARFGSHLTYARSIFDLVPYPDTFIFSTMIRAYLISDKPHESLSLFTQMRCRNGVKVDSFSLSLVSQACGSLREVIYGQVVHNCAIKFGFESDLFVQTALVEMYAKSGFVEIGRKVFDFIENPDLVSYNVLLAEYVRVGEVSSARGLFDKMPERDLVSWNTMIHGYASTGDVEEARKLFDRSNERDAVSWSTLIGAYARMRRSNEALRMFHEMQSTNVKPDKVTMVSLLAACGDLGALSIGRLAHEYIDRKGIEIDIRLGTSLVDMYAKCGDIESSLSMFDRMNSRDAFAWSAVILGLANHGCGEAALDYFSKMIADGVAPNDLTFIGVLIACSHIGLADVGWKYFTSMNDDFGVTPKIEHYACMVDTFARAGRLQDARELIRSMPYNPDAVIWRALLGGCRIYKNIELAEEAALKLLELEPHADGNYVLLSNIYSQAKKWDKVANVRRKMRDIEIKKVPGISSIEVNNTVHEFVAGDKSHTECEKIYQMLAEIVDVLKLAGYKPLTSLVSHDLEEQEKEVSLAHHCEKLAIAYGLLNTRPGLPIRIIKNLRICEDCHLFMKFVSQVYQRKIIVRDRNRFHHFAEGLCSCNDYW